MTSARLGVAALVLLAFCVLDVVLRLVSPPGAREQAAVDPLVATLQAGLGSWGVVLLCASIGIGLLWWTRPPAIVLRRELAWAAAGAVGAALLVVIVGVASGEKLPGFIPPEESAAPGRVLGLEAGISEEALFRLCLLPAIAWGLGAVSRWRRTLVVITSAVVTGLLFAVAHELPPAAGAFDLHHFVTRVLVPGAAMSLLFFWPGPAFIVSAHCGAHVIIPWLFL